MTTHKAWFVGEGSLLIQAAEAWGALGHSIAGVTSQEPRVVAWANEQAMALTPLANLGAALDATPVDYLFSVVNLRVLPRAVLAKAKGMAINFHDGPLPDRAGVNVPVWALWQGAATHGVTWHEMVAEADAGRLLVQQRFDIAPDETAFSLNAKCFTAGIETFRQLAEHLTQGTLTPTPQDFSQRTYHDFYDRPPAGLFLDFSWSAEVLARRVRALDFGGYPNPVGLPKVRLPSGAVVAPTSAVARRGDGPAATVLAVGERSVVVTCATGNVELTGLRSVTGETISAGWLASQGVKDGALLPLLDGATARRLEHVTQQAARAEGAHLRLRRSPKPLAFSWAASASDAPPTHVDVSVVGPSPLDTAACFFARLSGLTTFDVRYRSMALGAATQDFESLFERDTVVRFQFAPDGSAAAGLAHAASVRAEAERRFPPALELSLRQADAPAPQPLAALWQVEAFVDITPAHQLVVQVRGDGAVRLSAAPQVADSNRLRQIAMRLTVFAQKALAASPMPLFAVPLLSDDEIKQLASWNSTSRSVPSQCVHEQFVARAQTMPEASAVTSQGVTLSYRTLDSRANAVAAALHQAGVGPDDKVGLFLGRSAHMAVAALGIQKAGAAYVPLDPAYPRDRLAYMVQDAGVQVVLTDAAHVAQVPGAAGVTCLVVDDGQFETGVDSPPTTSVKPEHLAYVIYTSGSTGRPKGVMVEHRNVINFFTAMDEVLGTTPGTWLAVTSMSFDISVLELWWALTRGFHVVVHASEATTAPVRSLDFSLFYFASDEAGATGRDKYKLLLEGAAFADANDFVAVWTPERHFHAFGGLYPNPAVASAALAMVTKKVALRAGSCVAPLHSPIRIAEEWALVDNLSNGRVGLAFASGWHATDFAVRPEAWARRKDEMMETLETVRKLWRGEKVPFKSGVGSDVAISVLPRPVQKELPVWLTAAGNPETFEAAGRVGAGVLTHLLGQTFAEVAEKVRRYRAAWERAGHPGRGTVTLMLHTFVGTNDDEVKRVVREPMKGYLQSAVGLVKEAAWSFPTFKQQTIAADGSFSTDALSADEMSALLDYAFERYYGQSGLFGSVETALKTLEQVRGADVDEVGCLVDFGVPTEVALKHLPFLAQLQKRANAGARSTGLAAPATLGDAFRVHQPTHFQCTPSMASMVLLDAAAAPAVKSLKAFLVGGEALPVTLAQQLTHATNGAVLNMYGPTETTVWSTHQAIQPPVDSVAIGKPLANTDVLILDAQGQLCAPGDEGELCIGGQGVVRGYWNQPELTAQRFVKHPFAPGRRLYRTGDLASWSPEGQLFFKGRLDFQVKIRGYRLELGEIETILGEHPTVRECAVLAREDSPGDKRLVAYVVPSSAQFAPAEIKASLASRLPEFMVPQTYVVLKSFPKTPNLKLDRKALPAPEAAAPTPAARAGSGGAPTNTLESTIATVWKEVLGVPNVGLDDNFFDLGGHSLLTIQVLNRLKGQVPGAFTLVDLFRFTTVRGLAAFLGQQDQPQQHLDESAARGAARAKLRRQASGR